MELTPRQKANAKYYDKKKIIDPIERAKINELKYNIRIETLSKLSHEEFTELKDQERAKRQERLNKMTPEEIAIKKQKQSEYKAKFLEKKEQEIKKKKIVYAEQAREKFERDPTMFMNPD